MKALIIKTLALAALLSSTAFADCSKNNVDLNLNLSEINILQWNAKHSAGLMAQKFYDLGLQQDVFLFQEVDQKAVNYFKDQNSNQEMSSLVHNKLKFGVASVSSLNVCETYSIDVTDEPIMASIDKGLVVLKIKYKNAAGLIQVLKIINVHLPLFNVSIGLGKDPYLEGLEKISAEIQNHDGPVIVAGDFNGWTPARSWYTLPDFALKNKLTELEFPFDNRNRASYLRLDRIYSKGVRLINEDSITDIDDSDHYIRYYTAILK